MPFSSIKFPDYGWKDPAILFYNICVFFCHRYIIYTKGAAVNFDTGNTQRIKETLELTTFFVSSHIACQCGNA